MTGSTIRRYIHIEDFGPVGIDNGPDDLAFAAARAALSSTGYRTLIIGTSQYWLQNGFNLNAYTDANGINYPALPSVLITADGSMGLCNKTFQPFPEYPVYSGLPATIVLSPGYADPSIELIGGLVNCAYVGGTEPCRTTGSIQLSDGSSITNVRLMSLSAYQLSLAVARGYDNAMLANTLLCGPQNSMSVPVGAANGMVGVSAGGGTAVQFDGNSCSADNLLILGFRNGIASVPLFDGGASGVGPAIGAVSGDCANLVRIDNCTTEASYAGPIQQDSVLTSFLAYTFTPSSIASDGNGGTNILWTTTDTRTVFGSHLIPGAEPATNQVFTVTVTVTDTGGPCYNAANVGVLSPAGTPTNRYVGTITLLPGETTGTLNLAGIPIDSFYDATCLTAGTVVGTTDSSGTTLTISSIENGAVAIGQWVTPTISIESVIINSTAKSVTATCTLSGSLSASGATLALLPGVSATGSMLYDSQMPGGNGTTLVVSGVSGGTLEVGQLVTGAGVLPGTVISAGTGAGPFTVTVPQVSGPAVFTALTGAAFIGSIAVLDSELTVSEVAGFVETPFRLL